MKKCLKIIHVLFSKGFAGTERSTAESCNFQSLSHDVVLVCSTQPERKSGASILKNIHSNVKVIQISPKFFVKRNLQRIIDSEKPDIVHAHLRRSTRALAKCKTTASKISTLHIGVNAPEFLAMDGLVVISPWQLETIPPSYTGKAEWIRNSILPHQQPDQTVVASLREEVGALDKNTFVIGGIGRLTKVKGWDLLIKAFIDAQLPNSQLVIIGEGKDKAEFLQLANDALNIRFLSYKDNVKDYYSTFDVFVCPSRHEPMGRVVLEAMDAGNPVIASDIEGPRDTLKEYPGKMFRSGDAQSLKAAILSYYEAWKENPNTLKNRPNLTPHYIENISKNMVDFYRSTI